MNFRRAFLGGGIIGALAIPILLYSIGTVLAQDMQQPNEVNLPNAFADNPLLTMDLEELLAIKQGLLEEDVVRPDEVGSLLYTPWQRALLDDSKEGFRTRPPSQNEIVEDFLPMAAKDVENPNPDRGIRELYLGGILYASEDDWTVWLNGQRLRPNAIPDEVMDIKVYNEYVELKWFDRFYNLIYPIRLRPHQRFNIDRRIFLPGIGGAQGPANDDDNPA